MLKLIASMFCINGVASFFYHMTALQSWGLRDGDSMVFLAWGLKIFYAVVTDRYRPCGTRRRAYMIAGWVGTIALTALLGAIGDTCTVGTWLGVSIATQACMMLADVPAGGELLAIYNATL